MQHPKFIITTLALLSITGASYAQQNRGVLADYHPHSVKPAAQNTLIQIKGSDTIVNLAQSWAEAFNKLHPEVNLAVTGGGSGTGIAALISGTCEIATSSRAMQKKEMESSRAKGFEPAETIVALDGIAVVVHPNNPVRKLTIDQLRDIFMGTIRNWKLVGGPDKKIVILSREVNSGTHMFFKEHVLRRGAAKGPEEFSPAALLLPSSQAIADEVANNENAVGYYGMGYISPKQKVIAVAADEISPAMEPAITTVQNRSYPISRPLYIYTRGNPEGAVKDFIDFIHSAPGQEIVRKLDFVPLR
ncbi:MAG: PstS family phosphate ABC transporter substrate-binding protein [Candidatus Omnitrophica bacterium]|nr:PstS family phosphate ABC transporter substrate-binding protein [Candidatus Omnitrophota bacterium]